MGRFNTHGLQDWVESNPSVKSWFDRVSRKRKSTGRIFAFQLWKYWRANLSKNYPSIDEWVAEVRKQVKNEDVRVSRKWARDLEDFVAGTDLRESSRFVFVQGVKNYLSEFVDLPKVKIELESEGMPERNDYPPLTSEELRTLVGKSSVRDGAIVLTQISAGLGVGELVYFARNWTNYEQAIREKRVPIRIEIRRPKTKAKYWTLLWDDAVRYLNALLLERTRECGSVPENLFVNQYGKPIDEQDIQESIRRNADLSGLEPTKPGVRVYRFRPHALRHYFKTTCTNAGVSGVVSEFLLGHGAGKNKDIAKVYDEFAKTKDDEERILREMKQAAPMLNVVSRSGQPLLKDYESEIRAKTAKDTYKTLIEAGLLKPETLSEQVLKIIAEKVGVSFERIVLAEDEDTIGLPEDARMRVAIFDLIPKPLTSARPLGNGIWPP